MKRRLNQRSGFTLLELLMVVIIVGILAALAIPGYVRAVERSRSAELLTVLGQLKGSIQRYCAENDGVLPTAYTDLDVEDPAADANFATRWTVNFPATIDCSTTPVTIQEAPIASRDSGPCTGSTVDYDSLGSPPVTFAWAGPCA